MRIETKWSDAPVDLGAIGRTGENAARVIEFDCTDALADYPDASILCAIRRPCDSAAYLGSLTADGKKRMLTLTAAECAVKGRLHMELRVVDGDTVLKTATYTGWVEEALTGSADKPGNPAADLLNRIDSTLQSATETQKKLLIALDGVDTAVDGANAAADNAQTIADAVQAKLDNGDFVGAKGDKGDPGDVQDVQVAGVSVLTDGVANVPNVICIRDDNSIGVVNPPQSTVWEGLIGISAYTGRVILAPSTQVTINKRGHQLIGGDTLDYAVKAAMCDGKGATWTENEQKAAQERLGIDKPYELIEEITIEDGVSVFERETNLARMYLMIIGESGHTGTCSISTAFDSGHSFVAYWNIAHIAVQYELIVEHGIANGFYKFSNYSMSSTPTVTGINFDAMRTIFSATTKPSKINKLTISGPIPKGTKFVIYGVRAQ